MAQTGWILFAVTLTLLTGLAFASHVVEDVRVFFLRFRIKRLERGLEVLRQGDELGLALMRLEAEQRLALIDLDTERRIRREVEEE